MAKNIDPVALAVEQNSTEDIIKYISDIMSTAEFSMNKAIAEQNLALAGSAAATFGIATDYMKELSEKLNGIKTPTVIQ